jgi:hypothetical protein
MRIACNFNGDLECPRDASSALCEGANRRQAVALNNAPTASPLTKPDAVASFIQGQLFAGRAGITSRNVLKTIGPMRASRLGMLILFPMFGSSALGQQI